MAEYRAAKLPDGSVVADAETAWIRTPTGPGPWRATYGAYADDWRVDEALADGAVVLRVGTGEE